MKRLIPRLLGWLIIFAIVVGIVYETTRIPVFDGEFMTQDIEQTIRNYAVECYAIEGSYPSDLNYLEEHYGLILDYERYNYYYDAFASNVLPDISVFKKEEQKE